MSREQGERDPFEPEPDTRGVGMTAVGRVDAEGMPEVIEMDVPSCR